MAARRRASRAGHADHPAAFALIAATSLALSLGLAWITAMVIEGSTIAVSVGTASGFWAVAFAVVALRAGGLAIARH